MIAIHSAKVSASGRLQQEKAPPSLFEVSRDAVLAGVTALKEELGVCLSASTPGLEQVAVAVFRAMLEVPDRSHESTAQVDRPILLFAPLAGEGPSSRFLRESLMERRWIGASEQRSHRR